MSVHDKVCSDIAQYAKRDLILVDIVSFGSDNMSEQTGNVQKCSENAYVPTSYFSSLYVK